jgi:hypothetical protein
MAAALDVVQQQHETVGNIRSDLKTCLGMTLTIAVQLFGGHADYLAKVDTPIFGILLALADRTNT